MGSNRTMPYPAVGAVLVWLALLTFLPVAVAATETGATAEQPAAAALWTAEEWAQAHRFSPLPAPPPDPTNALADNLQAARLGQRLFFDARLSPHGVSCATCHSTPLFSDDEFHNLGLPSVPVPDEGRVEGLHRLQHSLLRGSGTYSDGPPLARAEDYQVGAALRGSFRTPSLRELKYTAPYGHNGALATLEDWLKHYEDVFSLPPERFVGRLDPTLDEVEITPQEQQELRDFLLSLSSDYASPWTQPPVGVPLPTGHATQSRKA